MDNLLTFFNHYFSIFYFYLPLGIIGAWRWLVWVFKKIVGLYYKSQKNSYSASVSIITPIYNEDPEILKKALFTWIKNYPKEIIAVIDYTDKSSIAIFRKFAKTFSGARLIITKKPGKREALADGIKAATGELVALVDSDTLWSANLIKNSLPPFIDPKVAGVTVRQNVLRTESLAQKIFDIQLDLRYFDEFPFLAAGGDALVCLSGRTSLYRRRVVLPMCDDLVHETFLGKPLISGDDKRLTYLVLKNGWKVAYQKNARVFTPGVWDLKTYMQQRLRWTRNSLRADLKAMWEGWTWKHPALAFFQVDKVIQAFAIILSPIYFFVSLYLGLYLGAALIFAWWFISRAIKIYPHLRRKPEHILVLPFFVLFTFMSAFIKIYALFTLNTHSWITRWDKARLPQFRFLQYVPAYGMSAMLFIVLTLLVYGQKEGFRFPQSQLISPKIAQDSFVRTSDLRLENTEKILGSTNYIDEKGELITKYSVQTGDNLSSIAYKFGVELEDLVQANSPILPNYRLIEPNLTLSIPYQGLKISPTKAYNREIKNLPPLLIDYSKKTNKIIVSGRGNEVSLPLIADKVGPAILQKTDNKEWTLRANLHVQVGVKLNLESAEVEWLKLASNNEGFVWIRSSGGAISINGVKITSWDENAKDYDKNDKDGRSFIMAKYSGRMDIYNSELAYLGYYPFSSESASSYGVSWKIPDNSFGSYLMTGEVKDSKFHHNYFGAYTYGATGMVWLNNQFYSNIQYGLDPHDDSNGFLVEGNSAFDNGNHGIIFSKRCINNVIRGNLTYNNKLHGIMLDRNSNNNLVENNIVYGNRDGIALYDSSNNTIRNNEIYQNERGIRANTASQNNLVLSNQIYSSSQFGIYLYGDANSNVIKNNFISKNGSGIYIKTKANELVDNEIKSNRNGIYLLDNASDNKIKNNKIVKNRRYGIYSKTNFGATNFLGENVIEENGYNLFSLDLTNNLISSN